MKKSLLAGAAVLALTTSLAQADGHMMFAPGEGAFNWDSFEAFAAAHDLSGQTLSITGPWIGPDAELAESILTYFEEATGATVDYSGSDSFEQDIVIATQAGSAPNIAVFPQPGLAADMASKGFLTPLSGKYIGYSDFRGNRQFMTAGNVTGNNRVSLILVDYPARRRLKIAGLASYLTAAEAPELVHQITPRSVERLAQAAVIIEIVAFDWNCPAHITPRWTELELQKMNELTV